MDWRDGRIRGWIDAPTEIEAGEGDAGSKEIVKEWAEEFRLEGLWGDDGGAVVDEAMMKE